MAKLYVVTVATGTKEVNVIAESVEEATAKYTPADNEKVVSVDDKGDIIA